MIASAREGKQQVPRLLASLVARNDSIYILKVSSRPRASARVEGPAFCSSCEGSRHSERSGVEGPYAKLHRPNLLATLDMCLQMFRTRFRGRLIPVHGALLIDGVCKYDSACLFVHHCDACGIVGMNIPHEHNLGPPGLLVFRITRDHCCPVKSRTESVG
jgi:hypothetical protein